MPLQNVEVTVTGTLRESFQTPTAPPPILPAAPPGLRTRFESIATNANVRATIHPQRAESDRRADRRSIGLVDSTDNFAVRKHVEIIVVPLAGWPTISVRNSWRAHVFPKRGSRFLRLWWQRSARWLLSYIYVNDGKSWRTNGSNLGPRSPLLLKCSSSDNRNSLIPLTWKGGRVV